MSKLKVNITTPAENIKNINSDILILPAQQGEMGVLYGHAKTIVGLKNAVIRLENDGKIDKYFIYNAIAHINLEYVEIIAEYVVKLSGSLKEQVMKELLEIKNKFASTQDEQLGELVIYKENIYNALLNYL